MDLENYVYTYLYLYVYLSRRENARETNSKKKTKWRNDSRDPEERQCVTARVGGSTHNYIRVY